MLELSLENMVSSKASRHTLRIIDANLNRIGEGLRVLEDISRFILDDAVLSNRLKDMRHRLITGDLERSRDLLQARDAKGDVGADIETETQKCHRDLALTAVANSRRVEQALRSIEEVVTTHPPTPHIDRDTCRRARFQLYTMERELTLRLLRQEKVKAISGLYAIVDSEALKGRDCAETVDQVIQGGARIIQFRDKRTAKNKLLPTALVLKDICKKHDAIFIVNDHLDIALAVEADGLHLGQDDLPLKTARRLLPLDSILGCSARTPEAAEAAAHDGADYIASGAIYPSPTKTDAPVIGIEGLKKIRRAVGLPLVAIGGITAENAAATVEAGADAVAVISAVLGADSPRDAARDIAHRLEETDEQA